jgi:hypothetical protein
MRGPTLPRYPPSRPCTLVFSTKTSHDADTARWDRWPGLDATHQLVAHLYTCTCCFRIPIPIPRIESNRIALHTSSAVAIASHRTSPALSLVITAVFITTTLRRYHGPAPRNHLRMLSVVAALTAGDESHVGAQGAQDDGAAAPVRAVDCRGLADGSALRGFEIPYEVGIRVDLRDLLCGLCGLLLG